MSAKITIITPSFNHAPYIRQTIESVLTQVGSNVEHIVLDGGSTDGTVEILREYGERYPDRFHWVSEPDRGQSDALNKGLAVARGEFIGWQNSDDFYLPNAFAEPIRYLIEHPDVGVVYSDCQFVDHDGVATGHWPTGRFSYGLQMELSIIANQAAFIRRDALLACGEISEDLHYAMDYELWLRLGLVTRIVYLPGLRGAFRHHEVAKTHAGVPKARREHVVSLERLLVNPRLPSNLLPAVRQALQHHRLNCMVAALAYDDWPLATEMLTKAYHQDPALRDWTYLCRWLLEREAFEGAWFGDWVGASLQDLPRRILVLLDRVHLQHTSYARRIIALAHLFAALRPDADQPRRSALSRVIGAIQHDTAWLRMQPAAGIVLLRLSCGDRVVHGLRTVVRAMRTRQPLH